MGETIVSEEQNTGAPEKKPGEEIKSEANNLTNLIAPQSEGATRVPRDTEGKADKKEEKAEKVTFEVLETKEKPGSVREFKLSVPWEEFDKRQTKMIKDLKKNVLIEGFRKGKAPERLIKIRYRKEMKQDVLDEIAPNIVDQILEKEGRDKSIDPVLTDSKVEEGHPLELVIDVETLPKMEIDKSDYTGMNISVKKSGINEKMVDASLMSIQRRNAVYQPKEDGHVEEEDGLVLHISVKDEQGMEIKDLHRHDEFVESPKTKLPKEIWNELLGKEKGAVVEVEIPREEKNVRDEIISAKDKWKVEVVEIKKCVLPELDDEFAKDLGDFETLEDLRKKIRSDHEEHVENKAKLDAYDAILEKILEKKPFEAPASYVEYHKRGMIQNDLRQLKLWGVSLQDISLDEEKYLEKKEKDAVLSVKSKMILNEIVQAEKMEVTDEDLNAEIAEIAEKEGRKALAVRAKLEAEKKLDSFKDALISEKIKKYLLDNNNILYEEVEPESSS
jgi:trigger factor